MEQSEKLDNIRHSLAHLLAAAVIKLYPDAKRTIGPAIDNGFYFDFEFSKPISEGDLQKIEKEMRKILPTWGTFEKHELSAEEAKKEYPENPYKHELIDEFTKEGQKVTFYKSGNYWDLCKGGHAENMKEVTSDCFMLDRLAGAYWRGDEKNKMLTRIYGLAFETKEELDTYIAQREEAKKRDHKKLGKSLDLFSFHPEAVGFAFWHPKGMLLRSALMGFHTELHTKANYQTVSTPMMLSEELWHKSGHWENYKDNMFFTKVDEKSYAIKPMNCPGTILIYKSNPHSYRDLPIRLAEAGEVHRNEPSGTLNGLFRVRAFRQDDTHIFAREDQIEAEVKGVINLTLDFYKVIGFKDVHIEFSTRPKKSIGSDEVWNKAEKTMHGILKDLKLDYKINEGDGAFYGPKIDFHIKDSLNRSWQCGTIQIDFFMPERFDVEFTDKDGQPKHPVIIHRTVLGSIQRFTGILIEHHAGAFPLWLSPTQVILLPVSDGHNGFSQELAAKMRAKGIRAEVDDSNEKIGAKIRNAQLRKIPLMLVAGDKESTSGRLAVRTRDGKIEEGIAIDEFIARVLKDCADHK